MINRETITVVKGRNSPRKITVKANGQIRQFISDGVTKLAIEIDGTEYDSDNGYVSYDNAGNVTFTLGQLNLSEKRNFIGRLIEYSSDHPLGRPIFHEDTNYQMVFSFKK